MWSGMKQTDRDQIQRNIKRLQSVDLSLLGQRLIEKKVIDDQFIERIVNTYKTRNERNQEFFLRYMKRGPLAFDLLVTALNETGHFAEAAALSGEQKNGSRSNNLRPSVSSLESPDESFSSSSGGVSEESSSSERSSNGSTGSKIVLDTIKIAEKYNQGLGPEEAYTMMSNPRGYALIINNIDFPDDPQATRTGAKADTENLSKLLVELGFKVTPHHNVTKSKLMDPVNGIFKQFIAQFTQSPEVDACVVAILSHGHDHDYLRTSDPGHTHINLYKDVIKLFDNVNCPVLFEKPKIFIIQACRGDNKDLGYYKRTQCDGRNLSDVATAPLNNDDEDQETIPDPRLFPSVTDILICYSTVPGFVSNRDIKLGTWYIQSLCETFREHCHSLEITAMLRKVGVKIGSVNSENKEKQMSSFKNMGFNRELYFNPGLYAFSDV